MSGSVYHIEVSFIYDWPTKLGIIFKYALNSPQLKIHIPGMCTIKYSWYDKCYMYGMCLLILHPLYCKYINTQILNQFHTNEV